ncbi:hypothetical protein BJF92_01785 [Rhizobium rhizosphaerae]|uniref:Uncharacterized protein n=1 Tax=Xaviernesmea rhizosphaerae TaxID=1672749 RepID=A0A1Q9AKM7_9HYPH|nr:hypothetical protein [Xaviernesmea rhizosphaerae]OLP55868.1 hypothetical protein BJF92_01785 [Xaviernesmea rhizosphaerae]OQP85601.1 hypothetical protein BTR14_15590 [Xaviernesmea rhizosphaerae]
MPRRESDEKNRADTSSFDALMTECRDDGAQLSRTLHVFDAGLFDRALLEALVTENRERRAKD